MAKVNVSIPDDLLREVDELASELSRSRSGFVQEATARYVAEKRAEKEARERSERIGAAVKEIRKYSDKLGSFDVVAAIRADRDSDHGRRPIDED